MENKEGKSLKEILEIIGLVLAIATPFSFLISYAWHEEWFNAIGLPIDLAWIKLEFVLISLLNIMFLFFFIFISLFLVSHFYLSLRGVLRKKENCILWLHEKFITAIFRYIIFSIGCILFVFYIPFILESNWIIIIPVLFFVISSSIYLHPFLDNFFKKLRNNLEETTYAWEDILAFPTIILLFLIIYFLEYFQLFYNFSPSIYTSLFYISLFLVFAFSVMLSFLKSRNSLLNTVGFVFIVFSFVSVFPILLLLDIAESDGKNLIKCFGDKSSTKTIMECSKNIRTVLPMYGLISSESLQKGTVFIENIESVYGATCLSKEECEQKVLKDRWFISFGETTLVFTNKNKQINILLLKDGKFLRSVQVKRD